MAGDADDDELDERDDQHARKKSRREFFRHPAYVRRCSDGP